MQINSEFEFQIKLVLIGDSGVGKTNFIFQFTEGRFTPIHVSTVGFDYKSKIIKLPKSKKKINLQIWDTAGQERYMAINKNLFQKVQGIILMYDLTNRESFEHITSWLNLIRQTVTTKTVVLVANKLDLQEDQRIVSESEGKQIAKDNNILFFEGSGCTGKNVDNIFTTIAETIYSNLVGDKDDSAANSLVLKKKKHKNEKKDCC